MAPATSYARVVPQAANGINELPPSTLAAQIVQNLETADEQPKGDARAHLQELLHMILQGEDDIASQRALDETLEENYRLIGVITKACIEPLTTDDPFEDHASLQSQARDSLAVIDLTIRRSPDVLFLVPSGLTATSSPGGPLFLWLIPHLINVISTDDEAILAGVYKVIHSLLWAQRRPAAYKHGRQCGLRYVRGCMRDLLAYVKARSDPGQTVLAGYIPTIETLNESCHAEYGPQVTSPVRFQDTAKDMVVLARLCSTLVERTPSSKETLALKSQSSDICWAVDCASSLWALYSSTSSPNERMPQYMLREILTAVQRSMSSLLSFSYDPVACTQAATLACRTVGKALHPHPTAMDDRLEQTICLSVADLLALGFRYPPILQYYTETLGPQVEDIVTIQASLEALGSDVQRALVVASHLIRQDSSVVPPELLEFGDALLRRKFEALIGDATISRRSDDRSSATRPAKRRKSSALDKSPEDSSSSRSDFETRMLAALKLPYDGDQIDLAVVLARFKDSSEEEQCGLFNILGHSACQSAHESAGNARCIDCDGLEQRQKTERPHMDRELADQIYETLTKLLAATRDVKAARPRVAALLALRRLLAHSPIAEHFDAKSKPLGQWALTSLRSSVRDIRIASTYSMRFFVEDGLDRDIANRNRPTVLDSIRSLADKNEASLLETCILGFGQIIMYVSSEEEVSIALNRLVEYLGHTNPLVSGFANEELLRLCKHDSFQAHQLFEPYWPSIAVRVVQNLQKRPQIGQLICDLLGIHVPDLLRRTRVHTIPHLVLTKQRDTLQKIAVASGPDQTVFSMCLSRPQLAPILSKLLLNSPEDVGRYVTDHLIAASDDFANRELTELLKTNSIYTAYELLKVAGGPDQATKIRAAKVLEFVAEATQRRPGSSRTSSYKQQDAVGAFFRTWALAIVQLLSDVIGQAKCPQSSLERKRCVGAIEEMSKLAQSHISNALPQISSCLRTAIEDPLLCNEALSAWMTLLSTLEEEHIKDLIDPTFAIIARYWDSFNAQSHKRAYEVLEMLFKNHGKLVRKIVNTIPSLASIPLLSKFEGDVEKLRVQMNPYRHLEAFAQRCKSENDTVVLRALNELEEFLKENQSYLQKATISEQPDQVIGEVIRSLLDACVRFKDTSSDIALRCARCLGLVGCIDPTKIESVREDPEMFVLSNFAVGSETVDFVVFFLREVLVNAYIATTVTSRQQMLAFGMQEFLNICEFEKSVTQFKPDDVYKKWISMPESTRNILAPFLTSKYSINASASHSEKACPLYSPGMDFTHWLRTFTLDLLRRGRGDNARLVFNICTRLVRNQDIAIASFLLPYAMLNIVAEGNDQERSDIVRDLFAVLAQPIEDLNPSGRESLILCSQDVFKCIDYLSRWVQEKVKSLPRGRTQSEKRNDETTISRVEAVIKRIPPKVIASRAVDCKSYARALFHLEQYIRDQQEDGLDPDARDELYDQLQEIYMEIDEPDGIEGISSCIHSLTMEQQILEDRKAGRWTAVQNWYEVQLEENPNDTDVQWQLLTSLQESGQYDLLLNQVSNLQMPEQTIATWRPFAIEAAWVTSKFGKLAELCDPLTVDEGIDFKLGLGCALAALREKDQDKTGKTLEQLMLDATRGLSASNTSTFQACHDTLLKFHVLVELQAISEARGEGQEVSPVISSLDERLEVLGAFSTHKQFLLGVRRAGMLLSSSGTTDLDVSSTWLTSAKLARKANYMHQASIAVLHASQLGDSSATIEHARLTWLKGHHRKAIQSLRGAIEANAFEAEHLMEVDGGNKRDQQNASQRHNMVAARAQLLLAKWIDRAGQTKSTEIVNHYRQVTAMQARWEKGHYHLGKHYNKLLESERSNPIDRQAKSYLEGDMAKLTIENLLRSLAYGGKYIHHALPKVLTLWLDFGAEVEHNIKPGISKALDAQLVTHQRRKVFNAVMSNIKKYIDRLPAYMFYTAFAQIVARICHPNRSVWPFLTDIVAKVIGTHPQQAMWPLLAMMNTKSATSDRAARASVCKDKIIEFAKRNGMETQRGGTLRQINEGLQLAKQLLLVCNHSFDGNQAPKGSLSLSRDMNFNHSKAAPCSLVIPIEAALLATLPTVTESARNHRAFSKDAITVQVILDEFIVLSSLIRPRRIKIRGSNGRVYAILCKPKDDLRKDQRLLEFNSMISRTLKKDAECSKRRLYIKTYAVTPLNEEHGLIEWVEGMRTLRDIFIEAYRSRGVQIDYGAIRNQLQIISENHSKIDIWNRDILGTFVPVLHEWFVNMFPEPSAWLAARLRYTRSCAVMSMVGHVLGLGDRHGENILLEEAQGGTFHVDFNCLFDKGKTFETPERVPFRLTHNMVDAFGVYKENGPFRKCCELTLGILRGNEDTLMTILETFLYDPTTDFIGRKKKNVNPEVPDTPEGVLENIRRKVRGLPFGESVPLSEEGYVQLQIDQARDSLNLARMYIGWCPFF